jgi:hypothetical protein
VPAAPLIAAPVPARAPTPLLLKITAAAGIGSLLVGLGLVLYFIVLDRHDSRPKAVAHNVVKDHEPQPSPDPRAAAKVDAAPAAGVSLEFPPVDVERGPKTHPTGGKRAKAAHGAKSAQAPASAGPTLDEKQKALMALYGKKEGSPSGAGVPSAAPRASGPRRQITGAEVLAIQKKHRSILTACYERALKRDDSLTEVKADVTVTIGDNGAVREVTIQGISDPTLHSCLRTSILHWRFDPIGEQSFKFPIVFRRS